MMTSHRRTIRNVTLNTAGTVVNMLSGLVVMPYLIQTLGTSTYGLWILIGTLTGYFGVLDLGVNAALGRIIAMHRARGEPQQVNETMSTAGALLLIVFMIGCLATCVAVVVFPHMFAVPPDRTLDVRYSLILVGFNLALAFPISIFSGFLWGYERFDLQNAIDIPILIVRTVLSLTAISAAAPLTSLGAITLGVSVLSGGVKMLLCFRLEPNLQLTPSRVRRSKVREIFSLGGWMSIISWSRTLIPQVAPTFIGVRIGNAAVTTFTVARQLVAYTNMFSNSATQVLAPRAVAAHATQSANLQTQLFIEGGKFASALAAFFCGGLLCLGLPFIHWWQHGLQDAAYRPLLILMVGESLPMSQWLTYSVLLGANRQSVVALLAVAEAVISFPLIVVLSGHGVIGVCVAVALSAFLIRGIFQWLYGCRLLRVSPGTYMRLVFAPVAIGALPPVMALYLVAAAASPKSFIAIFLLGAGYSVLCALTLGCAVFGYSRLKALVLTVLP
jgi:O-antigen/teichoic acid export membrane protein